ncbi:hypothetical protein [Staphylococcus xylosus]
MNKFIVILTYVLSVIIILLIAGIVIGLSVYGFITVWSLIFSI